MKKLLFLISLIFSLSVLAAPVKNDISAGSVYKTVGLVQVMPRGSDKLRVLAEGVSIFPGDRVISTGTGEALIKMRDAGLIAVRPNSEFYIEKYSAHGKSSDHQILRLLGGPLRIVTGWIAKLNRPETRVITPQATIGIRGTDHEPYVLLAEHPFPKNSPPGTYDKVNRGGTTLSVDDYAIDILPGRVGYVREVPSDFKVPERRQRALMTLLLPALLDEVPDFYVPGAFDNEMDEYAEKSESEIAKALSLVLMSKEVGANHVACDAEKIAHEWLTSFDNALIEKDSDSLLSLIAKDATAKATVITKAQQTKNIEFSRSELVSSVIQAVRALDGYSHRRLSLTARQINADCSAIRLRSLVVEQGKLSDRPYRFESIEEIELEMRDGEWLAKRLETTQR